MNASGLPHSEIPGSKPVCGSPELIAAYHVLHRHLSPRHSPYALSSLTIDMRTDAATWTFCIPSSSVNPSRHTALECVVGKNYRLQDIQLSKIDRRRSLGELDSRCSTPCHSPELLILRPVPARWQARPVENWWRIP